jgi:spore maturation protein CgeB
MDSFREKGLSICNFNIGLTHINLKWATENQYIPSTKNSIVEIGVEKITRFKPDIIFCLSPVTYIANGFIERTISALKKKPKLVAWYGANCGNEGIFSQFDLILSNSKHLVRSLKKKRLNAKFLQHSFELKILDKIKLSSQKINKISFFGNLNLDTDFIDRTRMIMEIRSKIKHFDIFANIETPNNYFKYKYELLIKRYELSKILKNFSDNNFIHKWADVSNLPKSPWGLEKDFSSIVHNPLYGKEMFQKQGQYAMTFNKHNNHTGNFACNMRMFEATGIGCLLITDNKSDIRDYFVPDEEVVVYNNSIEALEKINFLIDNPNVAKSISKKGMKKCHLNHNSEIVNNRLLEILTDIV